MLDEYLLRKGWWVLPDGFYARLLFKRLRKLRQLGACHAMLHLPVVIGSIMFELPVLIGANAELKRRQLTW